MDELPLDLQRDSRYYYYLSVYPGLKQMEELGTDQLPELPETVNSAYVHTPYCTGVCSFCSYFLTTVREEDTSPIASYLETVKEEVACQFEIPGLQNNVPTNASPSERKKLNKHHFAPLYSILGSTAT